MSSRILIVDAYEAHRKVMVGFIHHIRPDTEVHQFDPSKKGRPPQDFDWGCYQLIVMDSRLGKEDGLQWFEEYQMENEDLPPVMFLSSQGDVETAVQAMKLGARDFILKKNINQRKLKAAILSIVPPKPLSDLMPDLKPLPEHYNTMDYGGADTQVLPGTAKAKAAAVIAAGTYVEEVDDEVENYWEEQTQILHEPPA
jgi:CheY-like chemotaxis protein